MINQKLAGILERRKAAGLAVEYDQVHSSRRGPLVIIDVYYENSRRHESATYEDPDEAEADMAEAQCLSMAAVPYRPECLREYLVFDRALERAHASWEHACDGNPYDEWFGICANYDLNLYEDDDHPGQVRADLYEVNARGQTQTCRWFALRDDPMDQRWLTAEAKRTPLPTCASCASCAWYDGPAIRNGVGSCRHAPPTVHLVTETNAYGGVSDIPTSLLPEVHETDRCARHEPKVGA